MFPIRIFIVFLLTIFLHFLTPPAGFAESQIFLKDGRVIKVDNFWREEGMVKYESFGGIVGIPLTEVEKIITPDMVAFVEVQKTDTIDAYEEFLSQYPKSEFAPISERRIKALQFEKVKKIDTAPVYLDYIRRNPNSIFLEEAKDRAEILIFQDAIRTNNKENFQEYLEIYPEGQFAAAAKKGLEIITFQHLLKNGSISDLQTFAEGVSDPAFQKSLEERIAALQQAAEKRRAQKLQQKTLAEQRTEAESRSKRNRWMMLIGGLGLAATGGLAVFLLLRQRRKTMKVPMEDDLEAAISEMEEKTVPQTDASGVRYEDLVGAPKRSGSMALPGPDDGPVAGSKGPAALPEPDQPEEASGDEEEESFFLNDQQENEAVPEPEPSEVVIPLGYENDEGNGASPEKEVIDLSDHETDFKLELEDVSEEEEEAPQGDTADTESEKACDFTDGDFPDLMDDEERKKRRGGTT